MVRAVPGTVSLRKVPPRSTAAQDPEDRVEHLPRVTPLASDGLRGREKIANELPLPLVEFVPFYHKGSIAAERPVGVLRQALGWCSLPTRPGARASTSSSAEQNDLDGTRQDDQI